LDQIAAGEIEAQHRTAAHLRCQKGEQLVVVLGITSV
jgi:hypothetical protein